MLGLLATGFFVNIRSVRLAASETVDYSGGFWEKLIVETHDALIGAEISLHFAENILAAVLFVLICFIKSFEYLPVAAPETIDGLLHVANEQALAARGHAFEQEFPEILPLHGGGVLELVDHNMVETASGAFEHERRVGGSDATAEDIGHIGYHLAAVLFVHLLECLPCVLQKAEGIEPVETNCAGVEYGHQSRALFLGFCQHRPHLLGGSLSGIVFFIRSLEPILRSIDALHHAIGGRKLFKVSHFSEIGAEIARIGNPCFPIAHNV